MADPARFELTTSAFGGGGPFEHKVLQLLDYFGVSVFGVAIPCQHATR